MRRLFATLSVAALLTGLIAAPAVADEPNEFIDSFSFEATNPCSGEDHTVSIDASVSIHEHDGTFIVRARRTGTTSDGYILRHGRENVVGTEDSFVASFTDPWVNPDLGTSFVAQGRFRLVDGDVVMDDFRLVCTS